MRPNDAKDAAQSVERLNHASDERRIAAIAGENLSDGYFESADELFRFLLLLIGHFRSPSNHELAARSMHQDSADAGRTGSAGDRRYTNHMWLDFFCASVVNF
jgi:hypothetical protein